MHWLSHVLGLDSANGPFYLFWSGFGGDLYKFVAIGAIWHYFNCHEIGCWRLARYVTLEPDGRRMRRCAKHYQQRHS